MTRIKIIVSVLFVCCTLFSSKRVEKVNIWLIGDSTMAPKSAKAYPELGWGEGLADYVTNKAKVHNHAVNGRSSLSFINEGRWQAVYDSLQKGDYVIIQFGHNDEKTDTARHTEPFGSFKQNIQKFIDEAGKEGAIPIVCSSIVRRHFDAAGNLKDTHGDYITGAAQIARETDTAYVNMAALTRKLVSDMGPEQSKNIFLFTQTKQDSTHLNVAGAGIVAGLFVEEAKAQRLPIASIFK
ncbi:rhamnogalacturonan acetylesterase [uncultured Imperialibacter sp.]|uniref:rhamnogalacturonan acetylesterase n=1 Tax=uncultured Imperialibacter sp. TaxID=1672639 RepID=UPI0030D8225D|tara:strand:+ start:42614 stop:43330 length:717 start_codon:yes stop_codon:yes gene_type:complete